MVNFLRQPGGNKLNQSSGNRTSDLLRQHLAESAAQRISIAYGNRDQQVAPEPELIEPSFFRNMTPAIGKLVEHSTGQEIQKRQQARDVEAQQSAVDELANIYAAELDIPIERARLIASAPPEARKEVIKDIVAKRKEERGFENKLALEGIKQENKIKLTDYKTDANAKFGKDDPNRQWYQQGITATQNLNRLSKNIPYDKEGYFEKFNNVRKDEERVRNWITMAVAAAAPIAHLSPDQQKKLEADYLQQYYTRGKREQVIEQLEGTFNPANFESIQERGQAMTQQREQGNQPQDQIQGQEQQQVSQQTQLEQPDMAQEESVLGNVGDTAARGALRATANIAERMEGALKTGSMLPWTASLYAAEFVAPYLPEFAQKAVELNRKLYNLIQPPSVQDLKEKFPDTAKILEPQGTVDRIIDSVTNELPEMALAWGTGGAVVKPLVQGLLGGLSDEWLEAQNAPEVVKLGARLLTSIGTTGAYNAYKAKSAIKPQPIMTKLSKVVRENASNNYEEAKELANGIIVDAQPIKEMQGKLNAPGVSNAVSDDVGFKKLKNVLGSFFELTPEPMKTPTIEPTPRTDFFESFGKRVSAENSIKFSPQPKPISSEQVTLPTLFKGYKDLGALERKEKDADLKALISQAKKVVWETIQKTIDQSKKAGESVLKWNMANEGWAATEKLTGLERVVKEATEKYPGLSKSVILGVIPAFLGFGHLLGTERALLLGGAAGITAGAGALKRQLSYLKRPEVKKLFMEFLETGLSEDAGQTARNYRDIVNGFKKTRNNKQS